MPPFLPCSAGSLPSLSLLPMSEIPSQFSGRPPMSGGITDISCCFFSPPLLFRWVLFLWPSDEFWLTDSWVTSHLSFFPSFFGGAVVHVIRIQCSESILGQPRIYTDVKGLYQVSGQSSLGLSSGGTDNNFRSRCVSADNQGLVLKINSEASIWQLQNTELLSMPLWYFMCASMLLKKCFSKEWWF